MLGAESTSRAAPQWLQMLAVFGVSICLKMLLVPAYFSTDFDVHQNWLRITATRPFSEWYWDEESKWTLDYPPLFAYFEWMLAQIAITINPLITASINRDQVTVHFQRASVILSEVPLLLVLYRIIGRVDFRLVIAYFSLPFIILDNVHFQYNTLMQALFLIAVHLLQQKRFLYSALAYSTLLNFKHIYLYAALAFFAYILKHYVLAAQGTVERVKRLVKVGAITLIPFIVAFLPFLIAGLQQIPQILSRLFPFQRGLIHDYWAPNFWALYYFADKVINLVVARLGGTGISFEAASQLHRLRVLPQASPFATNIIVLLITLPLLIKMIRHKMSAHRLVFLCGAVFFLFGFHVHEKAITPYVGLLLVFTGDAGREWLLGPALMVNLVNLQPLLIAPNEKLLRLALPLLWVAIWQYRHGAGGLLETTIFATAIAVTAYQELLHPLLPFRSLQFLPLMINSVFAATFNIAWISVLYMRNILKKEEEERSDGFKSVAAEEQADA